MGTPDPGAGALERKVSGILPAGEAGLSRAGPARTTLPGTSPLLEGASESDLAGLAEADVRVALLGELQVDPGRRQIGQVVGAVAG